MHEKKIVLYLANDLDVAQDRFDVLMSYECIFDCSSYFWSTKHHKITLCPLRFFVVVKIHFQESN